MPLRFPNLSIFVAAAQTDAVAVSMMTEIDIAGTVHEVQVLIGTADYALALQAFFSSSQQERDQAIRHAEIILAIARADSLLADDSLASQRDTTSQPASDSRTTEQSDKDNLNKYIEQTQRTQAEQQAKKQQVKELLEQGCSVEEVALQTGVASSTIRRWRGHFKKTGRHIPYAHERRLTRLEAQQLKNICRSKTPRVYDLPFDQWTPDLVCKVAQQLLHKTLSQEIAEALLEEISSSTSTSTSTPTFSTTEPTVQPSTSTVQPSTTPRRHDRAYSGHIRTTAIEEITVKKRSVLTVAAELGIAPSTLFRWLKQEGHALPGRSELLTQHQRTLIQKRLSKHTPSTYHIAAERWDTSSVIALIGKIFYKTLTAEQVEELFPELCPAEIQSADHSPWLPNDELSAWLLQERNVSPEQTALDQQLLQQLLSEGVQGSLVPTEEVSTPPHPSASPSQSPSRLTDQWLPDKQLNEWLLQQGSSSSTALPTSSPVTAARPPAATGLRQREIEELRMALSTRTPRHYGIDAGDWTLEVIQRLIRQLLERELTREQVLDLLTKQGISFHKVP